MRREVQMKKRVVLPMAILMILSCAGLSLAQPTTAEPPAQGKMAQMGKAETSSPAKLHHLAGEVVAVDQTAKTVTIKHMVRGQAREATFSVGEKEAASLANLQPNDRVRLSYSKEQGRLMAQSIVTTYHKASK
jgi:Cu/Ag efflux protein CusF